MKTRPIEPADIRFDPGQPPAATRYGDIYHARAGALAQAQHVFLQGNGLPGRWAGRQRFTILETGLGLGGNFLATLQAWRDDPQRPRHLHYIGIEQHPPGRQDLLRAWGGDAVEAECRGLAMALADQWPPLTPNLHVLPFENGQVELLLALGDAAAWLRELVAEVDAFYLDGFAPDRNPAMWADDVFRGISRLAVPGATVATWSAARVMRDGLAGQGFVVERRPGFADKRDMTVARFEPRFQPQRAPARRAARPLAREAIIIGGGLAGATTAWALQAQGLACTVLDAAPHPAAGASGITGGIYRAAVHRGDNPHARFNRGAALWAATCHARWSAQGGIDGQHRGLLHPTEDAEAMRQLLPALGLPATFAQVLTAPEASALAGVPLGQPAWLQHRAGWIDAAALVHWLLAYSGARWSGNSPVARVAAGGAGWQAWGARGQLLAEAPVLVLAHAGAAAAWVPGTQGLMQQRRGQLSIVTPTGQTVPRLPMAGAGHALTLPDGRVLCGSTSHPDDTQAQPRDDDDRANLQTLSRLTGDATWSAIEPADCAAFVGWRSALPDRLPMVGPVPMHPGDWPAGARAHPVRLVPRQPGLFVLAGLGSRGLTWAPLAAHSLAAAIVGAPQPLEADLLDAIDPARFISRRAARGGA
ncbi:MAG: FAD-dependent 5-carboxymethylaminomethyl-2-thiouridine(34) oxidoreductase MnmC [Aquabacterium sp.]